MTIATATAGATREPLDDTQRLLMRLNPSLFYGLAYALTFEAAAPVAGTDVASLVARNRERRLQALRGEVAAVWPEFDWTEVQRAAAEHGALAIAFENSAVQAAAVWVSLLYGMMARLAPAGALRRCLQELADVQTSHAVGSRRQRIGQCIAGWRALRRLARPLRIAQALIAAGWRANSALPALSCVAVVRRFIVASGAHGVHGAFVTWVVATALHHDEANHPGTCAVSALASKAKLAGGRRADVAVVFH